MTRYPRSRKLASAVVVLGMLGVVLGFVLSLVGLLPLFSGSHFLHHHFPYLWLALLSACLGAWRLHSLTSLTQLLAVGQAGPNHSFKPTPLRGAA